MRSILLLLVVFCIATARFISEEQKEHFFEAIAESRDGYEKLQMVTHKVLQSSASYLRERVLQQYEELSGAKDCLVCRTAFSTLDEVLRKEVVINAVEQFAVLICNQIESLNNTVCPPIVEMMGDIIVPVLTDFLLSPDYMCNRVLEHCSDVEYVVLEDQEFVDRVLAEKPETLAGNDYVDQLYEQIKGQTGRKTFKAAHYSDVHVDFEYTPGTNANCNMPLCCRLENGYTDVVEDQAGEWGSFMCDPPHKTVSFMFEYIRDVIKPDVLFWTGDMTPHNVWSNSEEEVISYNHDMAIEMQTTFESNFMVYPMQGNHDVWPVNVQSYSTPNAVVQSLTTVWNYWLDEEAVNTFKKAGYYDQQLKLGGELVPNTRVLAVSTQPCNAQNWYLWEVLSDPGEEIAWLEERLKDMEAKGEAAILIAHIPTSSCLNSWGSRFQALMDRYQDVVRFGMFGHSHSESFFLTRSVNKGGFEKSRALAFNSVLAPTTTYTGKNPSFAVYEIDYETMVPVDITTYYFDVEKANAGTPEWKPYHNILEDYEMEDLSPKSFEKWAERILEDEEMAVKYLNWNHKDGSESTHEACDRSCRESMYCKLLVSYNEDKHACRDYLGVSSSKSNVFEESLFQLLGFSTDDAYEIMADPWLMEIRH